MTTARSIVCGSCGADVPYGRLSCPACGDLLASVAGGTRRASAGQGLAADDDAATFTASAPDAAALSGGERVTPAVLHDSLQDPEPDPEPEPESAMVEDDAAPLAAVPAWSAARGPATAQIAGATLAFDDDPEPPFAPPPPIIDGDGVAPSSTPSAADLADDPPPFAYAASVAYDPPPGAYVPPLHPALAGAAAISMPAGPAAPARAWAGHGATGAGTAAGVALLDGSSAAGAPSTAEDGARAARIAEFIGWLTIAGGALAAVGFLLPWGASMIGAIGVDFFARWGLAGPFHILVALAVVATVVLAIVPNPVPSWIRVGLAGTILGTFLLGLVWPYIFGFSITGPGAYAVGVGAAALLAAGIASLVTDRHGRAAPPV
jgi:hypothetical protein